MILRFFVLILAALSLQAQSGGSYRVLKTAKVGGDGGFDYVYADSTGRRLYVPRTGANSPRLSVYNLDTLEPVGEIPGVSGHGVAVSTKSHHGFLSSKPVVMFDSKTLASIKEIPVEGGPDGILYDPFNDRVWVFSHRVPNVTLINAGDGSLAGTIDLTGAPEQAVSDGKGHVYVDLEDKDKIAVVDAKTLMVTTTYDVAGKGGTCAGLAFDQRHEILFATCRKPANMVVLSATDGKIVTTLPIGTGTDGAVFNPKTKEAFSSQGDGTLTIVKESNPTTFEVEQTLQTMPGAKTLTLDTKTNHIILIAAQFGPPPVPPPSGRPTRGPMVPGSFAILVAGK